MLALIVRIAERSGNQPDEDESLSLSAYVVARKPRKTARFPRLSRRARRENGPIRDRRPRRLLPLLGGWDGLPLPFFRGQFHARIMTSVYKVTDEKIR